MTETLQEVDLFGAEETQGPQAFSAFPEAETPQRTSTPQSKSRKKDLLPSVTSASREEVEVAVDFDSDKNLEEQAKGTANLAQTERVGQVIQQGALEEKDPNQVIIEISEEISQSPFLSSFIDPTVVSTVMTSDNELAKRSVMTKLRKVLILHDAMSEKASSKEGLAKWLEVGADFGDAIVTSLVPVRTNLIANERANLAKNISELVSSDLDEEEFKLKVDEALAIAESQGILTESNSFMLGDFFALLGEGGQGPEAESQKFWAWFDTLTVVSGLVRPVVGGATGVAKAVLAKDLLTDSGTLLARTGKSEGELKKVFKAAILEDDPSVAATNLSAKFPSSETPASLRGTFLSAPEHTVLRNIEEENELLNSIRHHVGAQAIDDEIFLSLKDEIIEEIKSASERSGSRQVIDHDLHKTSLENLIYTELWGTVKGSFFKGKNAEKNANKLAEQINGTAVQVDSGQWAVKLEQNVPLAPGGGNTLESLRLFKETDPAELGYGFWAKFGTPLSQTTDRLNAILKQGEAFRDAVLNQADVQLRKVESKVNKAGRLGVDRVFRLLRDGDEAFRRTPYSADEFAQRFQRLNGRRATDAERDYFFALQQRNDVAYFLQADIEFKNAVNQGQVVLQENGLNLKVVRFSKDVIPENDLVWSFDKKRLIPKSEVSDNVPVYSVADTPFETPIGEKVQFVVGRSPKIRRLFHSDVLNYNPGGPRVAAHNSVKFFVKQNKEVTLASGRKVSSEPLTAMGVRTEDEARLAVKEINEIIDAIKTRLPRGQKPEEFLVGLGNDSDLARVIQTNNTFHTGLQSVDDLIQFSKRTGLSLVDNVDWVPDGSRLVDSSSNYLPGINPSRTIVESFNIQSIGKGGRRNEILLGFGGEPNRVEPAIDTIKKNFESAVVTRTEASFLIASVNGLMKELLREGSKAMKKPLNQAEFVGLPLRSKLSKLKGIINETTEEGRKLALERDKIEMRLTKGNFVDKALQGMKDDFADKLYGKGWKRTAETVDRFSADPVAAFKGWTFDVFLGLGAWRQYYVQSSQIVNIVGDSLGAGVRGVATYPFVRFAIANGNEEVIQNVANRLGPVVGLKPAQFKEMIELLRENGRLVTNLSITELGEDSAFTGGLRRARQNLRFFFSEGELTARISAHATAYIKYLEKFGKETAATQHGRRWIAGEADRLTQSMTSASRNPIQQLPMLQFLTYTWNMTEQMLSGSIGGGKRILSNRQKATMLSTHVAMYGLTGLGITHFTDRMQAEGALPLSPEEYGMVRNGLLDVALSGLLNADTALSGDLAWAQGLSDLMMNMADANLVEALAGPSGTVVTNTFSNFSKLVTSIASGSPDLIKQDLTVLARQIKSVDMSFNAYMGWRLGLYFSRNGEGVITDDITKMEAVALGLGIPLERMEEMWSLNSIMYNDSQTDKTILATVDRLRTSWELAARQQDWESVDVFRKQIGAIIQSLPAVQQDRILRKMPRNFTSKLDETAFFALQQDLNTNIGGNE